MGVGIGLAAWCRMSRRSLACSVAQLQSMQTFAQMTSSTLCTRNEPVSLQIAQQGFSSGEGACLTRYSDRKMLGYSPGQIFEVVSQVEHYSKFVPWCMRSTVVNKQERHIEAELEVGFQLFVERYISKVTLDPPHRLCTTTNESTLFHHLDSEWKFEPGPTSSSCLLHFKVDFAFKSPLYQQVASVFFEEVVKKMLGAFEARCHDVYGPSSMIRTQKSAKPLIESE